MLVLVYYRHIYIYITYIYVYVSNLIRSQNKRANEWPEGVDKTNVFLKRSTGF